MDKKPIIALIRSGGQTGTDRAALEAGRANKFPISGWCPRGGWAEDQVTPPGIRARFPELVETPDKEISQRTEWNVRDSHATVIIGGAKTSYGTMVTMRFADVYERPFILVNNGTPEEIMDWLEAEAGRGLTVNFAGPRESEMPGIQRYAYKFICRMLEINEEEAKTPSRPKPKPSARPTGSLDDEHDDEEEAARKSRPRPVEQDDTDGEMEPVRANRTEESQEDVVEARKPTIKSQRDEQPRPKKEHKYVEGPCPFSRGSSDEGGDEAAQEDPRKDKLERRRQKKRAAEGQTSKASDDEVHKPQRKPGEFDRDDAGSGHMDIAKKDKPDLDEPTDDVDDEEPLAPLSDDGWEDPFAEFI